MIPLLLLACGGDLPAPPVVGGVDSAPPTETASDTGAVVDCDGRTWTTVGQPFLLAYCTACHSQYLDGERRKEAPEGVDLDDLPGLRAQADRVAFRVGEGTMPASGGPSATEIERFLAWLECGAPGPGTALTPGENDTSLIEGYEAWTTLTVEADFPEGLTLTTWLNGASRDGRTGVWSTERYLLSAGEAWFVGLEILDAAGAVEVALALDPPLSLGDGGAGSWSESSELSLEIDGVLTVEEREWSLTAGEPASLDARTTEQDPVQLVLVDSLGEVELGWLLSQELSLSGRWSLLPGRLATHQQTTVVFPWFFDGFPLEEGLTWNEKLTLRAEEP